MYIVNELTQFKHAHPEDFESMEIALEKLCALSNVVNACDRKSVRADWPMLAQHYNSIVRKSLIGLTVVVANDPEFGEGMVTELEERKEEMIKTIDDLCFNITIHVRSLVV